MQVIWLPGHWCLQHPAVLDKLTACLCCPAASKQSPANCLQAVCIAAKQWPCLSGRWRCRVLAAKRHACYETFLPTFPTSSRSRLLAGCAHHSHAVALSVMAGRCRHRVPAAARHACCSHCLQVAAADLLQGVFLAAKQWSRLSWLVPKDSRVLAAARHLRHHHVLQAAAADCFQGVRITAKQ